MEHKEGPGAGCKAPSEMGEERYFVIVKFICCVYSPLLRYKSKQLPRRSMISTSLRRLHTLSMLTTEL